MVWQSRDASVGVPSSRSACNDDTCDHTGWWHAIRSCPLFNSLTRWLESTYGTATAMPCNLRMAQSCNHL
jgi:hypothetical protein